MVNLLRRRKDESRRSLLARAGKKKPRQLSDEPAVTTKPLAKPASENVVPRRKAASSRYQPENGAAPRGSSNSNNNKMPRTPPLTPDNKDDDIYCVPISNVTVGQGRIHLPKGRNSKKGVKDDEQTEYSDLTDNRTLKRLNEQKAKYEEALRQAEMRKKATTQKKAEVAASKEEAQPKSGGKSDFDVDDDQTGSSFLSDILGLMDSACKTAEPEKIEGKKSFAPEWGVAPSVDHGDRDSRPHHRGGRDNYHRREREVDTYTEDDAFTDMDPTVETGMKESVESTPKSAHENFEMVLEELEEDDVVEGSPKRRSWKNPFKKGKKEEESDDQADAVDSPQRAPGKKNEKDIENKVKQALFPELEDDPVELKQLPPRKQTGRAKKAPHKPYREEQEEEEKKEEIEDPGLTTPLPGAQKKRRGGGIFRSFRRKSTSASPLEPVQEDAPVTQFDDDGRGKSSSKVASPRQHPVQKKVVDDIYRDLLDSHTGPTPKRKPPIKAEPPETDAAYPADADQEMSTVSGGDSAEQGTNSASGYYSGHHTAETSGSGALLNLEHRKGEDVNGDHGVLGGFMAMITETVVGKPVSPEVENMSDQPKGGIPQSKSLQEDKTTDGNDDPSVESLKITPEIRRSFSAPKNVQNNDFKQQEQQPAKKPEWKEVKDPKTGRSYFYHRKTRQTTWTRPKEMQPPEEQDLETKVVDAELNQPEPLGRSKSPRTRLRELREAQGASSMPEEPERRNSQRVLDSELSEKRQEIVRLLQSMAPPDGASIEELMAQYDGREDELLAHVRKMKDSRPFDEPLGDEGDEEEGDVVTEMSFQNGSDLNTSNLSEAQNRSMLSRTRSGVTSKQSESTQQIANTRSRNMSRRHDETTAGGTSISSYGLDAGPVARVPSKIPVRVRSRELMVEDVSSDRKSETYTNDNRGMSMGYGLGSFRRRPFTTPSYRGEAPPIEEENENDADSSHGLNDSVSALSMNEMEFAQPGVGMDDARRRALNDAIQREDWEMAAAISEGMKALKRKDGPKRRTEPQEWRQSELDKFISENDWDAVSGYIANLRSGTFDSKTSKDESSYERKPTYSDLPTRAKSNSFFTAGTGESEETSKGYSAPKPAAVRYDDETYSSYDESSSDYGSEYSSEESSSGPRRRNARSRRRRPSSRGRRRKGRA